MPFREDSFVSTYLQEEVQCSPAVLSHVESAHSGSLLRAPHLQDAPPRRVDHQELSHSAGALGTPEGGGVPLFWDSFVEVLYHLDPANLRVPIPWGRERGMLTGKLRSVYH